MMSGSKQNYDEEQHYISGQNQPYTVQPPLSDAFPGYKYDPGG